MIVLAGCTTGGTNASATPSPVAPASASAPASAASSPSPVAALPCRMPATLRVDQGGTRSILGWLTLPSGATTDDPINHIIVAGDYPTGNGVTQPIWATDHSPQLFGTSLGTYSAAIGRWLPAPPELVSPDGQHYAYLHPDGTLRLAAADQSEAIVPNPQKLTPLAFTTGVVLTSSDVASNGLWLLDPTSHGITAITPQAGNDDWRAVSNSTVWGTDSPGVLGYPAPTKVLRTALPSGGTPSTAYTAPGGDSIALIAADRQAGLLVALTGSAPGLAYIAAGGAVTSVSAPAGVDVTKLGPRHYADAHGTWFIGYTGVFLFSAASGLQSIAPAVTTDIVPGGDCT
jgi:hypothetical protein